VDRLRELFLAHLGEADLLDDHGVAGHARGHVRGLDLLGLEDALAGVDHGAGVHDRAVHDRLGRKRLHADVQKLELVAALAACLQLHDLHGRGTDVDADYALLLTPEQSHGRLSSITERSSPMPSSNQPRPLSACADRGGHHQNRRQVYTYQKELKCFVKLPKGQRHVKRKFRDRRVTHREGSTTAHFRERLADAPRAARCFPGSLGELERTGDLGTRDQKGMTTLTPRGSIGYELRPFRQRQNHPPRSER
jgi:hypothetical protein